MTQTLSIIDWAGWAGGGSWQVMNKRGGGVE